MAAKPVFNEEQQEILRVAAMRVWKRMKADGKTQEDMALALDISQQSVSNLLKGTYHPGIKVAQNLANLDGKKLEQLVGEHATAVPASVSHISIGSQVSISFANLDLCIGFHANTKHWSPWTIAAARAGFFGQTDFPPPEWTTKLDFLEKTLERAKKAS